MKPYSDIHEIPELKWRGEGTGKKRGDVMRRHFNRTEWARPIVRVDPKTQRRRYFLTVHAAGMDLAQDRLRLRCPSWGQGQCLAGNIRTGAESRRLNGYGIRYGYKWEWCTEAEAFAGGADCI